MTQNIATVSKLKLILANEEISFQTEAGWDALVKQVDIHQRKISGERGTDIRQEAAISSWYKTIYSPMGKAIRALKMRTIFSGMKPGDLYLAVSAHWLDMKGNYPWTEAKTAAESFITMNGKKKAGFFDMILELSNSLYKDKMAPYRELVLPPEKIEEPKRKLSA